MIALIERGHPAEYVFGLDIVSFSLLAQGSNRVANAKKIEEAWTQMIAAQGNSKTMKEHTKPWQDSLRQASDDAHEFLKKYGGGI